MDQGPRTPRMSRRALGWLVAGWVLFGATSLTATAATARFFFPNVTMDGNGQVKFGHPSRFEPGISLRFT